MFLVLITKIKEIRSFFSIFICLKNIRIFINDKYWITLFVKLEIGQFVFLLFLSPLFFFFFLVYNYYRLRYQSIYKHMKRGFLRRTFEYRWKKRKKKKWCMYWFPLYRCFGTASWTNALHICSFRIHLETRSMKFFKRLSMFWT